MNVERARASFLWEGQIQNARDWKERLNLTEEELNGLIKDNVLRITGPSAIQNYRIDLVGLLFTRHGSFVVLPKIFRNIVDMSVVQDVIACIRVYTKRLKRRLNHAEASEFLATNEDAAKAIDLFLALVDWTLDRGLHSEDFELKNDEPTGIDWQATMDHGVPLHIKSSIVYSEIIGRRADIKLGPLAFLQARAILELHAQLRPASQFWLSEYDELLQEASNVCETHGETEEFLLDLDGLSDFITICNKDHDRDLANILFDWLSHRHRSSTHPIIYGTTSFNYIWEDICNAVTKDFGEAANHRDFASQPFYKLRGEGYPTAGQKPDVLKIKDGAISIFDAKWYDVNAGDLPGVQDILKQVMYQISIKNDYEVSLNAFLVPIIDGGREAKVLGNVVMAANGENDVRFPPVAVIGVPWKRAVASYCGLRDFGGAIIC